MAGISEFEDKPACGPQQSRKLLNELFGGVNMAQNSQTYYEIKAARIKGRRHEVLIPYLNVLREPLGNIRLRDRCHATREI
jgi:hypothetical protein